MTLWLANFLLYNLPQRFNEIHCVNDPHATSLITLTHIRLTFIHLNSFQFKFGKMALHFRVIFSLVVLLGINPTQAQIRHSADLNCNFSGACRWRNSSNLPPTIGWTLSNDKQMDDRFPMSDGKRGLDL